MGKWVRENSSFWSRNKGLLLFVLIGLVALCLLAAGNDNWVIADESATQTGASPAGTVPGTLPGTLPVYGKDVDETRPAPGQVLTYTVWVENTLTETVYGLRIYDYVPTDTTYIMGSGQIVTGTGSVITESANLVVFDLGDLALSSYVTMTLGVTVSTGITQPTWLTNTAYPVDQYGYVVTATVGSFVGPDLTTSSKVDTPDPVDSNGLITYTIEVSNTGTLTATDVYMRDEIPEHTSYVSVDGGATRDEDPAPRGRVEWTGDVGPGQSHAFHLVVHVDHDAPSGTITNTATVDYDAYPQLGCQTTTTVVRKYWFWFPWIVNPHGR